MKKILSIDGGGIRGLIPALVLAELEQRAGRPLHEAFDLIAGTSTGGIIALGLTKPGADGKAEHSASDLADLYRSHGRTIFTRSFWRGVTSVGGLADEKYDEDGLEDVLQEYLGDVKLASALQKVFVTTYDLEARKPLFLKSWKDDRNQVEMWRAGRATSAAPTYFEPARVKVQGEKRALIDGGVFVNNPALSAYAEAKRLWPDETDFVIASVGTGEHTRPISAKEASGWGLAGWAIPLLNVVFDGVSDAVNYQLDHIVGEDRHFRFQTELDKANDDMDNASRGNLLALEAEARDILDAHGGRLSVLAELLNTP